MSYDDSMEWNSGEIINKLPIFGVLQQESLGIAQRAALNEPWWDSDHNVPGDFTPELRKMFGEQDELKMKFAQGLGLASGLQGEQLKLTDDINEAAESENTSSADFHGGGRY
ncbi:hypothetical protein GCM10022223_43840 [Kineosporia mesophila]|uniref:Uncharacterized protein n=1 Tax=Kineosporia mesophila TaxID=566012 RepID=A0ABP6ZXJ1_9ACTN|nr:hypothetical protein [Kineosporia mesophila]MCD5348811.1 hypothetical protein [Kineosporia mesophila]